MRISTLGARAARRRKLYRFDDLLIPGATAEIPADRITDRVFARCGIRFKQRMRGDQHAWCAVAALQSVRLAETVLQHAHRSIGIAEPFDGRDLLAIDLRREDKTGTNRFAIEEHAACTANAVLAADVRTGQTQFVTQKIDERRARSRDACSRDAVDFQRNPMIGFAHVLIAIASSRAACRVRTINV